MSESTITLLAGVGIVAISASVVIIVVIVGTLIKEYVEEMREREFITKQAYRDIERLEERVLELEGRLTKEEDKI